MNTTNLTQYRIPYGDPAWFRFRNTGLTDEDCVKFKCDKYVGGIGSSETAHILRLMEDWEPCPQAIYHHKVGTIIPTERMNMNMLMGQIFEPIIGIIWKLYEGPDCNYALKLREYMDGDAQTREILSVRKSRKLNGYYVNNNYPHLFSSFDFFAEKGTVGLLPGPDGKPQIFPNGFPIECKRIRRQYANTWKSGLPEPHHVQLNQEMICSNSIYGEIAVIYDDNKFEIFPFYRDNDTCKSIIHWGGEFWNKVLDSRGYLALRDKYYQEGKSNDAEHMQSLIDSNEPDPLDSSSFNEWKRERMQDSIIESTEGDYELYENLQEDDVCLLFANMIKDKRTGIQNKVLKLLDQTGAAKIDFGAYGYATYYPDKNGKKSVRKNFIFKPSKELAEKEFQKLNFNLT